jgi:hypothetical protein
MMRKEIIDLVLAKLGPRKVVNITMVPSAAKFLLEAGASPKFIWIDEHEKKLATERDRVWCTFIYPRHDGHISTRSKEVQHLPREIILLSYYLTSITDNLMGELVRELEEQNKFDDRRFS